MIAKSLVVLRPNPKKNMVCVDYNLTLCPLQSRVQHIYHGQPHARVDLNPIYARVDFIPQSGTSDLASVVKHFADTAT